MSTTLEMIQAAANLLNGNGVFYGDPLFLKPDGSFVNKDGVALAAGKLYTDGTDLYVFGSGSLVKI